MSPRVALAPRPPRAGEAKPIQPLPRSDPTVVTFQPDPIRGKASQYDTYAANDPLYLRPADNGQPKLDEKLDGKLGEKLDSKLDDQVAGSKGKAKGKGKGASEGEEKAGEGAADGKGAKGGGKDQGKFGKLDRRDAADADSLPEPELGTVALEAPPLRLSEPSGSFDAPMALPVKPAPERTGKGPPDPVVKTYAAVFAEAASAARRLHDGLIADAARAVGAMKSQASAAAGRRQGELDLALTALDEGLGEARLQLDGALEAALTLLQRRAASARGAINGAAKTANDRLEAAAKAFTEGRKEPDKQAKEAVDKAKSHQETLKADGDKAVKALQTLADDPESVFAYPGAAMGDAVNEAKVTRAPKRANRRRSAYADELAAQTKAMEGSFSKLQPEFDRVFADVNAWEQKTSKLGPDAVKEAQKNALGQVTTTTREIRKGLKLAKRQAEAAMIQQHAEARRQSIAAHRSRAQGEVMAEMRRGERDAGAIKGLAVAQGSAMRAVTDNLARQVAKGEKAFARSVSGASKSALDRFVLTDAVQRPRLSAGAAEGRLALERQSRDADAKLAENARGIVSQMQGAAGQTGAGLRDQAREATASFPRMADPVSAALKRYAPPVELNYKTFFAELTAAVGKSAGAVESYVATGKSGEQGGGAPPPGGGASPKMIPKEFMAKAKAVAGDVKTDAQIADLDTSAKAPVEKKVKGAVNGVWSGISVFGNDVNKVMDALRTMTARQGTAVRWQWGQEHWGTIDNYIRANLPSTFSTHTTDTKNVEAAINYLNGNNVEGALAELQASVNWSNEEARIEKVSRSLSPAQWAELKALHPEELADVRGDLEGLDGEVFDALESEGDAYLASLDKGPGERMQLGEGVAKANALRLRTDMDRQLDTKKDVGADNAADNANDALEAAALRKATDPIAGGDALGLEEREMDALDPRGLDELKARSDKQWGMTKEAFDKLEGDKLKGEKPENAKPGWAIAAYLAKQREYEVDVVDDPGTSYGDPHDRMPSTHKEKRSWQPSEHQKRLAQMIVDHGPESDEAAAARLMVEDHRDTGKAKPERVKKAMGDTRLDAHEGEDRQQGTKEDKQKRIDEARARQVRVLGLVAKFEGEAEAKKTGDQKAKAEAKETGPPAPPKPEEKDPNALDDPQAEALRKRMQDKFVSSLAGDPTAQKHMERAMRATRKDWAGEDEARVDDANAAFDYAIAHEADREKVLEDTFGRMDRSEIDKAVGRWDAKRPPGKGLYQQLNLFGKGSWWTEKVSGDARQSVELAAMGVSRNDQEKAEKARMRSQQQIRDAGWLGIATTWITGDWQALEKSQKDIEDLMGLPPEAFDDMGRIRNLPDKYKPNFDKNGKYIPKGGHDAADLEVAMHMTHLKAEAYKAATDRIATAVVTGLMVAAAVLTTALTGGAAASIWIPVLVTLGAGLAGMALTASIKGDRYSRAEAERDFVMALVQAATAGAGAAVGAAIKGGTPALRLVAGRMVTSEKLLEQFAARGLSKGWAFFANTAVAGGSNALNQAAGAYMDPAARAKGESGQKAWEAGLKGFFTGAAGGIVQAPASAAGGKAFGKYGERALGSAFSNLATTSSDIGWDKAAGKQRFQSTNEAVGEMRFAFLQGLTQGALEEKAGRVGDRRQAAKAAKVAGKTPPAAPEVSPTGPKPSTAEPPPAARPEAEGEPPIPVNVPPEARPAAQLAAKELRPPELPPVTFEPTPVPTPRPEATELPRPPRSGGPDDEPQTLKIPPRVPDDEEVTQVRKAPTRADDDEVTQVRKAPTADRDDEVTQVRKAPGLDDDEVTQVRKAPKKKPPLPAHELARRKAEAEFWEGAVMIDGDPKSLAEIEATYRKAIKDDPSREVAIYRNPETGEHILVFGDKDTAFIGYKNVQGRPDLVEAPHPATRPGEVPQAWKELLGADQGRWELEAHYHPGAPGQHDDAPMWRRIPSSEGGDLDTMEIESQHNGNQPRESVIHFMLNGREVATRFGHDPTSAQARFWIDVENPATGKRERHGFPNKQKYDEWAAGHGAAPNRTKAPATPSTPSSGRPDEQLTIHHGTTPDDEGAMKAKGVDPHHKRSGDTDDFGHAFYASLTPEAGKTYADTRAGAGQGVVISATIKVGDLGVVVDVRDGGAHRAQWDAFLDRKPAPYPPEAKLLRMSAREFMTWRKGWYPSNVKRGVAFELFLTEIGMNHADAVIGPLGKSMTSGIGSGEQIAFRTKKAANVLNEKLGYPPLPEDPKPPGMAAREGSDKPGILRSHDEKMDAFKPRTKEDLASDPDPMPEFQGPKPEARPAPTQAEIDAHRKALRDIDTEGVNRFLQDHPDGPKLAGLLKLAPEAVLAALGAGEPVGAPKPLGPDGLPIAEAPSPSMLSAKHEEAVREALRKNPDLSPAEIEAHIATLKDLLRTPEQRVDDFRLALAKDQLTDAQVEAWKSRQKGKKGKQVLSPAEYDEQLKVEKAKAVLRYHDDLPGAGGGVRQFIDAARERSGWTGRVPADLDAQVAAAIDRKMALAGVASMRGRKPKVATATDPNPTPHRAAFQELDGIDRKLLTELAVRVSADPAENARLAAEWGERRRGAPGVTDADIARETALVKTALDDPELLALINQERTTQNALGMDHSKVRQMVLDDPTLLALAATDPALFAERYAAMVTRTSKGPRKTSFTAADLRADLQDAMSHHLRPALSESTAAFRIAAETGAQVLEVPSMTKGRTNDPGIDAVLFVPPEFHPPGSPGAAKAAAAPPENLRIILVDDKAEKGQQLSKVTAMTENLPGNLREMALEHQAAIDARAKQPRPTGLTDYELAVRKHLDDAHKQVVKQLLAAADALDTIDAATKARGVKSKEYGEAVAKVLKAHGIEMKITSEYGKIVSLPVWMTYWGFAVWEAENRRKRAAAAAAPLPPAPPPPPPLPGP